MLSKTEIISGISAQTGIGKGLVKHVLDDLAALAEAEVAKGEDFTVPGIARISWAYRKPQKKGERWKKGETVQGFGGVESVKDSDSPPVKAKARLTARPTGIVGQNKPKSSPEEQAAFLKTSAGKAVAKRKG